MGLSPKGQRLPVLYRQFLKDNRRERDAKDLKSTQVAGGGLSSALCLLAMLLSGVIPFATYALPAVAGAFLIPAAVEIGTRAAYVVYTSVSLLAFIMVPDREAALMFIFFFDYYPVFRLSLESHRNNLLRWLLKTAVFNASMILSYWLLIHLFGLTQLLEEFGGVAMAWAVLGIGNIIFVIYETACRNLTLLYRHWFRKKFLMKK